MPTIRQLLAPESISYNWNSPEWVIVHYTATEASAYSNALYFSRGGNGNSSAHYFVDGSGTIYQSVPDSRGAWHAGNYGANTHSIGIEVVSSGRDFTAAEIAELAWLVKSLMSTYGIPPERVIRHFDVADVFGGRTLDPHKRCPAPYIDAGKWAALHAAITAHEEGDKVQLVSNEGGDVYRLYNPNTGFHHYTTDMAERDGLAKAGWKDEGAAWTAKPSQRIPVYRMYSPRNGDHVLTADFDEAAGLQEAGWKYEGVPFFASDGGAEVHRLYNPNSGEHFYTASGAEAASLEGAGWRREGVAFRA